MSAAVLMNTPLREVRLYGELGRRFGRVHQLAVESAREAVQALSVVVPGFERYLREHSAPGYHVFVGKRARGHDLAEKQLDHPVGAADPIMLVPAIAGAKRQGVFQTILGAVLAITGTFLFPNPTLVKVGAQLALGGVIQMISAPRTSERAERADVRSFGFDGPVNTDEEGLPVPLAIGRVIVGGARISAGISTDEMPLATAGSGGGGMSPAPLPGWMPRYPIDGGDRWDA